MAAFGYEPAGLRRDEAPRAGVPARAAFVLAAGAPALARDLIEGAVRKHLVLPSPASAGEGQEGAAYFPFAGALAAA